MTQLLEDQNKDLKIEVCEKMCAVDFEFKCNFLKRFISEVDELIGYCDNLIEESAELKLNDINTDEQFKNAGKHFENTKKWLRSKKTEFEKKIKEIEAKPDDGPKVCPCCGQLLCDNLECPKIK